MSHLQDGTYTGMMFESCETTLRVTGSVLEQLQASVLLLLPSELSLQ